MVARQPLLDAIEHTMRFADSRKSAVKIQVRALLIETVGWPLMCAVQSCRHVQETAEPTWGLAQSQREVRKGKAPILKTFPDESTAPVIAVLN